jgi:LPS-assembly lipoprotein
MKTARRLFLAGALAMLAGCGFQPVYMPSESNQTGVAQRGLKSVFVANIPDRPGQLMRQALQSRLSDDDGTASAYELVVGFSMSGEGIAIQHNALSTRLRLIGRADWSLRTRDGKGTVLASGTARAIDGVNVFDTQYFAQDLEVEAKQQTMAEALATQIVTQVAIWFRQHPDSA